MRSAGRWSRCSLAAICLLGLAAVPLLNGGKARGQSADTQFSRLRDKMVDDEIVGAGVRNERVIEAMRTTPRHEFVPRSLRSQAYFDMALPIGEEQTISAPFIVAYMTERLDPQPSDRVLEIGTGSGYQAAVLSALVKDVYTIEIVEKLGRRAKQTLARVGCKNVHAKIGDGYLGWPEEAPFDKIIVTCSPEKVPQPLIDQLVEGGRMIVPVGERFQQTLYLFTKVNGQLESQALEPIFFVPMTGTAEDLRQVLPELDKPALGNGGFEATERFAGRPETWYYLRQAEVVADVKTPEGKLCIKFSNATPGRKSQALQAIGVDGRKVSRLNVSLWVRAQDLAGSPPEAGRDGKPGAPSPRELPRLAVHFFNERRAPIGGDSIGLWTGTFDWREEHGEVAVPRDARLAIVGVGLFGGTGELSIDDISIEAASSNRSVLPE